MAEFLTYEDKGLYETDDFRPYSKLFSRQSVSLATIVLFNQSSYQSSSSNSDKDFLNDFSSYISTIFPEASRQQGLENNILTVINPEGGTIPNLKNSSRPDNKGMGDFDYYGIFNNFSLMTVTESNDQIVKIHQNFSGYWNAFFFGESPTLYNFGGIFLDTVEYPYFQEFSTAYENFLCGRKCIENKMKMKIIYDGRIAEGYIIRINTVTNASDPSMKQFTFTLLVTDSSFLRINKIPIGKNGATLMGINYLSNMNRMPVELIQTSDGEKVDVNQQPAGSPIGTQAEKISTV